jgi:hypothetical protein
LGDGFRRSLCYYLVNNFIKFLFVGDRRIRTPDRFIRLQLQVNRWHREGDRRACVGGLVNINLDGLSWISRTKETSVKARPRSNRESNSDPSGLHVVVPLFLDFDGFPADKLYYSVIVEF